MVRRNNRKIVPQGHFLRAPHEQDEEFLRRHHSFSCNNYIQPYHKHNIFKKYNPHKKNHEEPIGA